MADLIGQRLGQYEITARLGSGGMATVYRARQSSVGRDVAIKVIESRLADNPEFVKRFEREARTIAAFNHSHILKLFDYGQHGDQLYLVMELLQGGSLTDRIQKGALDGERASRILDQMASALDYAHGKGIIHRDLKPQNVLFDEAGDAHLTDFGIAKVLNETSALTGSGTAMGTPAYMSPEQCQGRSIDARADTYALGIMLYEMLAGELPFKGDTPVSMIYMHLQEPPPAIRVLRPDLPTSIEQVIFKALAKDPANRFQTAGDLAAAFKAALTGQTPPGVGIPASPKRSTPPSLQTVGLTAPVPAGFAPPPPGGRGRSWLLILGGLAVILILGALAASLVTSPPKPTRTPESPTAVPMMTTRANPPRLTPTPSMLHTPELNATAAALRLALQSITATAKTALALTKTATPSHTPNLETRVAETFAARETQTVTLITKTPTPRPSGTPNEEQTLAAIVGATDTAVAVALFTKTPTPTNTPTAMLTFTPTLTATAVVIATCTVTTARTSVEVHSGPGIGYAVLRFMPTYQPVNILAQAVADDKSVWWKIELENLENAWVDQADVVASSACSQAVPPAVTAVCTVTTARTSVEVHSGPGIGYAVLRFMPTYQPVNILAQAVADDKSMWWKIELENLENAWVDQADVVASSACSQVVPPAVTAVCTVTTARTSVEVHSGPGMGYAVLRFMPAYQPVNVLAQAVADDKSVWWKIELENLENAWVDQADVVASSACNQVVPPAVTAVCTVTTARTSVEVHSGPGIGYAVLRFMPVYQPVNVLAQAVADDKSVWWKIELENLENAWVDQADVVASSACNQVVPPTVTAVCTVTTARTSVEVHSGPGIGYAVLRFMPTYQPVKVLTQAVADDKSVWWKIELENLENAWVDQADVVASTGCVSMRAP